MPRRFDSYTPLVYPSALDPMEVPLTLRQSTALHGPPRRAQNPLSQTGHRLMKRFRILHCLLLSALLLLAFSARAATFEKKASDEYGTTYWGHFSNAPFPADGYPYKDSTVAIFVPKHFCPVLIQAKPKKRTKGATTRYECYSDSELKRLKRAGYRTKIVRDVDFVVHFHGHMNTVDKAMANHKLRDQFSLSLQNAILVIPQGPVNAIDSAGGKLEKAGGFKRLMAEVQAFLIAQQVLGKKARIGRIILSSHSGGYRVAAYCLKLGGIEVSEVMLFDSLYGSVQEYYDWIIKSKKHRFISVFFREKPRARSAELMKMLHQVGVQFAKLAEADMAKESFQRKTLARNRVFFVETGLGHSGCTRGYFNFRDYLFASRLKRVRDTDWFQKTGLDKMH